MADEIGTQSSPRMHSSPHNHHPLEQPEEDENEGSAPTISASRVNFSNHNTPTNNMNVNNGLSNAVIDVEALELKDNSTDVADGPVNSIRRKWEYFPGKNHFYCDGRVMTAPSIRFCVLSFALILVTFSLFIVFDAPFLTERLTVAIPIAVSILFVSVVVNMVKTSFSDPGILPRASQQEADHLEKSYYSTNFRPPPRTKDIVVNGQVIKSKYCFTCKMFRPPRASHCGICDNCVDRFDHHCPFLGNCIGKRNYRSFYAFIVSLSFLAVFILSASIAHLVMLSKEKNNFLEALRDSPSSAVVILISFFGMWTVIGLTGFHTYLIAVEQTTNEDIKGLFGRANAKNPFSHGNFCQNCCFVLCGPSQPSLIDPRGLATAEFIASLPRKGDHNGMLSPEKTQQHTQVVNKLATNNGINGEFHQPNHGGSFIGGGTNKIFREHPPSAQTVQPIQHQPLQFSSSSSSTAPLEVNPDVHSSKSSVSGLPSLPPEEKMLLKGPIRNGRMDYRQTIPDSSGIEEIQLSPQEEPVISPSAASTVSLSTLSTSNLSTNNDYDVVVSPVGGGDGDRGVVGKVPSLPPSVRHQFNKNTRLNNGNHSKRLFPSSSIDQLDDVIDPSDFDDDLDMPSLSNINEIEISRRPFNNVRASNNNKSVFSGGDHLTKSTRSLPSTSLEENFNGRASAADIHKIHQLPITTSKSSVNNIKASSSSVRNLLVNKSGPGRGTKSNSGDGVNSNNKKRSHDSTMQNSPLHLDTIM